MEPRRPFATFSFFGLGDEIETYLDKSFVFLFPFMRDWISFIILIILYTLYIDSFYGILKIISIFPEHFNVIKIGIL